MESESFRSFFSNPWLGALAGAGAGCVVAITGILLSYGYRKEFPRDTLKSAIQIIGALWVALVLFLPFAFLRTAPNAVWFVVGFLGAVFVLGIVTVLGVSKKVEPPKEESWFDIRPPNYIELNDIQGIVLRAYGRLPFACYLFLKIEDAKKARAWLREIVSGNETTTAEHKEKEGRSSPSLNIAFSAPGLRALGLSENVLATFPQELDEGMAEPERSRILGDTGDSAPENWELGGPGTEPLHVLLMLFAKDPATLKNLCQIQRDRIKRIGGVKEVSAQEAVERQDEKEPFGFRDGISQPAIAELKTPRRPGQMEIKAGEFILGYANEYDKQPFSPRVSKSDDPKNILHSILDGTDDSAGAMKDLGRNGSYLVFRKLKQDVAGFWNFMRASTTHPDSPLKNMEMLAAKCVGRWPSGAPLVLASNADNPNLGKDDQRNNDFMFAATDPNGYACPIGAHIRRCNPRDSLPPTTDQSLQMVRRHQLMRRGRPYGTYLDNARSGNDDGAERGLLFVAINANIRRQFEFVQQTWIINEKFGGLYDNKDPLIADNDVADGNNIMTIQSQPVRKRVPGIPRFVQVMGGGYFFLPSIKALKFLAG
jgi:Dyp-type peroxidase family